MELLFDNEFGLSEGEICEQGAKTLTNIDEKLV